MIRHKPNKVEAFQTSMVATFEEYEQQKNQDNLNEKYVAKPPIFTDTFGSNSSNDSRTSGSETPAKEVVGNSIESEVVVGLSEEFQEGDMVDALSRVEQKSSGNWKELDNESEDRKVERDAKREGEPTILATFGSDREDPNMKDKQEVKKADDQEIKNVKDEKGKYVEDQQVSEQTINETTNIITSLQSEVVSLEAKGSLDANEEIKKAHTRVHELKKQMEKLPMELQLNNNFREALETRSKGLERKGSI
ncbi:hypothetical protein Tco_1061184 [Tanacetum coccineum]